MDGCIRVRKGDPPKSLVVKMPNTDALARLYQVGTAGANEQDTGTPEAAAFQEMIRMMHNDECAVYRLLSDKNVVPVPRCHVAMSSVPEVCDGVLVLEDLKDSGVCMRSFADYLNLNQTLNVTEALAIMHAWSVNTSEAWRHMLPTVSERYNVYRTFTQMTPMLAEKAAEHLGAKFGPVPLDKIKEFVNADTHIRIFDVHTTPRQLPSVLVHGDVHSMNIMFERGKSGAEPGDKVVALFDWQLAHQGYGIEDMARLLTMGTSSALRREHCDDIIQHYVDIFNAAVTSPDNRVTFANVKSAFKEMFVMFAIWFSLTAVIAEDFLKKSLEKLMPEERQEVLESFIDNNACMFRDAVETMEW